MAEYLIQDTTLDAIADAINAKTGGSSAMTPAEMVTEIGSIQTGGGSSIAHGMVINEMDSAFYPLEVTILGDTFWSYALGGIGYNKKINKVNAPDAVVLGNEAMRLIKGSAMQDLVLPKVEYIAGGNTIYDCLFPRIFLPLLNTNAANATAGGQIYDTALTYIEIGSIGHPTLQNFNSNFFRGNTQAFDCVIFTEKTTLAEAQALFSRAPWNATNVTIIYKNSVTGEVLT